MRVVTNNHGNERGHILLTALVMSVAIAIGVGSFAILVSSQNKSITRSEAWNQCIPVAECGVEEALTQLYYNGTNTPPGNGWTVTNGTFFKQRSVGTAGNYFTVSILPSSKPVVTAVGYTVQPLKKTNYLARTVQVKTAKAPAPRGGIVARNGVTMVGGAILDSFDSSDPLYSTNGMYTAAKRKDNGQIISNGGNISLAGSPNGGVYGYAVTGPTGTVTTTGGAAVGDIAYQTSGTPGVQSGHVANNANVDFSAVQAPSTGGTYTPSAGAYSGTNYTYLLQNANYYTSTAVNMSGGSIGVVGNVTLYVNNSFTTSGQTYVYLYPGAKLKLYISGSFSAGGGGIINGTGTADQLTVYGTSTNSQTWSYTGQSIFVGTVYAPYADFNFAGGAGAIGSFTGNTVTIAGNAAVHYDEHLSSAIKGYTVSSWNEL